jgi:glycerol-3-phosphate dehydrogenase
LLQGTDGRVVFAIPYETDFTLIGTTDMSHENINDVASCSSEEKDYLLNFVNEYFEKSVTKDDIVWSYAGVRPLLNDGSESASAISRDYFLDFDQNNKNSPLLNIYGGKITTYRKLAEDVLEKIRPIFPTMGKSWTEKSCLPGGDFAIGAFENIVEAIFKKHIYLGKDLARRLIRLYGNDAYNLLANKKKKSDLGEYFGSLLYAFEIDWAIKNEWVTCSEDFLWRRTKLGLRLDNTSAKLVDKYIQKKLKTIPDL